jgi:hypothetical protein
MVKAGGEKHLRHCLRIAETFPDFQIVSILWRQLSWSHIKGNSFSSNSQTGYSEVRKNRLLSNFSNVLSPVIRQEIFHMYQN